MKIARLKRKADAVAADARAKRLEYRAHAARSVALVRRRVGSPAGLAISFSIGFIAGTGSSSRRASTPHTSTHDGDRGITNKPAHGPVGESAIKLATALAAHSLMKFIEEGRGETESSETLPSSGAPSA
jgi:hypothetical protein